MKKSKTEDDELRSEYDLKALRVRKLGPSRKGFEKGFAMSQESPFNDVIKRLIGVGKSEKFDKMPSLFSPSEQLEHPRLADSHEAWLATIQSLTEEDLIALIKSLTVGEHIIPYWSAGSVSPVIRLFWRLHELNSQKADVMVGWILDNTTNTYLPFGSCCVEGRTVAEFTLNQLSRHAGSQKRINAEEERQRFAKAEKLEREAQKATQNLFNAVRRNDEKAVEALIQKGANLEEASKDGVSVMSLAEEKGNKRIIELLIAVCTWTRPMRGRGRSVPPE
jgi:hypothetical protein